jgi:pimeloyl-ACP methyl ester carboxylesterase
VLKSFAEGRLFGSQSGTDRPWVLALPGWTRTHQDFDAVLDGLAGIAVDLPGFGATPAPPDAWSTADYAEWIAPVLDDLAPRPVILGHSFGGRVAVHLAAAHPERIGALVLSGVPLVRNPSAPKRRPALAFRMGRTLHRYRLVSDGRMEALRQRYGSEDYRRATGVMRGVLVKAVNETYEPQLAAYPGPIELVWGEGDNQATVAVAEAARANCAASTLTVCEGVGHFTPQQAPGCLREAILRHRPVPEPRP